MSTRANEALSRIPVSVEAGQPGSKLIQSNQLQWRRRALQAAMILIFILIPLTGVFRIDPAAGAFVMLGRQIWFSDFFLVFGFWVVAASMLTLLYSSVGAAFCGWACPQNTLSEWANRMTHKFLGKRADVSLDGVGVQVSAGKRKWTNWAILGGLFLGVSMLAGLIPLLYFYSPEVMWSFITFRDDARLAASLHYIYAISVIIIFVDIALVRYFFCRFMCIYRVWMHSFKTKQTLHIAYDETREAEAACGTCNYCVNVCPVDIDPRNTTLYDSCINCSVCISACDTLQARKGLPGLLRFEFGERSDATGKSIKSTLGSLLARVSWTLPVAAIGLAMFCWGLFSYQPYHFSVYRAETLQGNHIQDYRINIANKLYRPQTFQVSVLGLPKGSYELAATQASFLTADRQNLNLHVKPGLAPGLHSFRVQLRAADGWQNTYQVEHFVARDNT